MKFLFFCGREHHFQKLNDLAELLTHKKHSVKYLLTNNSVNIDPSTEFIWRSKVPYIHAIDFLTKEKLAEIDRQINSQLPNLLKSDLLTYFAPYILAHSFREAVTNLVLFDDILNKENPDFVVVLHANNFWTKILLYLAQQKGIKTVSFQEGMLRHRDEKTQNKQSAGMDYVDYLFVWGKNEAQSYVANEQTKVFPVGGLHLSKYLALLNSGQYQDAKRNFVITHSLPQNYIVFAPPLINRYEGNFLESLTQLATYCYKNSLPLVLKLHPFDYASIPQLKQLNKFGLRVWEDNFLNYELFLFSNAIVSQHSTTVIEAIAFNKPVIELDLQQIGILESKAEQGLAYSIKNQKDFDLLKKAFNGNVVNEQAVAQFRKENYMLFDGMALQRVAYYLEQNK